MKCLESQIARYRKVSRFLCFSAVLHGKLLRLRPQSEFHRVKIDEIMLCIYGFRRLPDLKPSAFKKRGTKKKLSFWY